MVRSMMLWPAICLLAILLWTPRGVKCEATEMVNSFEENWIESSARKAPSTMFSPPKSPNSTFKWVPNTFGPCFGCGRKSFKTVMLDCIHRLPMNLKTGGYSKSLIGVFKVPDEVCEKQEKKAAPAPLTAFGCGPPCSDLRLLRGKNTGCRCDTARKLAYDVPHLVCQDNRNRTVSLALCKFLYEQNVHNFHAVKCDYAVVCTSRTSWIADNWTECSHENSMHQRREVLCVSQSPSSPSVYFQMHADSMCLAASRPVKMRPCARWTAEKRFTCKCNIAKATRLVLCLRSNRGIKVRVDEAECSWHEKPATTQPCTPEELARCGRSGRRVVK